MFRVNHFGGEIQSHLLHVWYISRDEEGCTPESVLPWYLAGVQPRDSWGLTQKYPPYRAYIGVRWARGTSDYPLNIYLHLAEIYDTVNVGKYSSPMEHLGICLNILESRKSCCFVFVCLDIDSHLVLWIFKDEDSKKSKPKHKTKNAT